MEGSLFSGNTISGSGSGSIEEGDNLLGRPEFLNRLGYQSYRSRRLKRAEDYFRKARKYGGKAHIFHYYMALTRVASRDYQKAIWHFRESVKNNPAPDKSLLNLAAIYQKAGFNQKSREIYFRLSQMKSPYAELAGFAYRAMSGRTVEQIPPDYVEILFDSYSDDFDRHLQKELKYQVPDYIEKLCRESLVKKRAEKALDIGCGTGLSGEKIVKFVPSIDGVDISEGMLRVARSKQIYDHLFKAEVTRFLRNSRHTYDLVVAGDVFIYFGDLREIFSLVCRILKPGGHFIFTTELMWGGDFEIQSKLRYSHSDEYVLDLMGQLPLKFMNRRFIHIRRQSSGFVEGAVYSFQRTSQQNPP